MMHSHILIILRIEIVKIVLILVVMDDALAHFLLMAFRRGLTAS